MIPAWVPALVAGGVAQMIKLTLAVRRTREWSPRTVINLPGMPSTWAAMCGALCTGVFAREGLGSPVFWMTVAYSCLVLYDALKLRQSASRQARLLNALARDSDRREAWRHLRELLGETPAQVTGGLVVGILVAMPWVNG